MNTRQIEYILAIAEEKNMTRAAEKLFVSQSSLSQSLIKLEEELGCPLFTRDSRGMELTAEGELYVQAAKEILKIRDTAYQQIRAISRKRDRVYRVGVASHGSIKRFLAASEKLHRNWPGTEVYAVEDDYKGLINKMRHGQLAVSILSWNAPDEIPFSYRILSEEEILLVAPKGLVQGAAESGNGQGSVMPWSALNDRKMILTPEGTTLRNMTDSAFRSLAFAPKVICELKNVSATVDMVRQIKACAFLPEAMCQVTEDLEYFHMQPKFSRYQLVVYGRNLDAVMRDFVNILLAGPASPAGAANG